MKVLQELDPQGVEERSRRRLQRRVYHSKVLHLVYIMYHCQNFFFIAGITL